MEHSKSTEMCIRDRKDNDSVAQLVEQQTLNLWVQGSIPCWVTKNKDEELAEASEFRRFGEMVEWSITAVLKTAVPRGTGGSNPSLSAQSEECFGFFILRAYLIQI